MTYQKKSADDQPQTIGEVSAKLGEIMSQVKNFGEDVAKKMQAGETVTEELKQRTDKSLTQMAELKERLTELEQKSARRQEEPPQAVKTLGQMVIESEAFKGMGSSARRVINDELPYLLGFLKEHGSYKAFLWRPPVVNQTIKVVCREWDIKAQNLYADVSCQFDEVMY